MRREDDDARIDALVLTPGLLIAAGCGKDTEPAKTPVEPGKPKAENTFNLTLPSTATNIAQGGDEKVTISVDRGDNLTGEIGLDFAPPEGVTISPESPTIAADKSETQVTVKIAGDAAMGEKSIPVTGKAGSKETSGSFLVEVTEK